MADLTSGIALGEIKKSIESLRAETVDTNNRMMAVQTEIDRIERNLKEMQEQFIQMSVDQKRSAALQRAISELVRVRQEINRHFKDYETVRATMVGVLQATDLALVKRTTISRVSEELMLATPSYWLAPCLVAVAAWIDNDRALAERAIAEAMRRDEEKTALTMALICRRNGRTDTCFEWLAIYFSKQDATSFTMESFTYVDAYMNGVFGVDKRHLCDGFVKKWIGELRGEDENFEARQEDAWREYCCRYTQDTGSLFPVLRETSADFSRIDNYIGRISSVEFLTEKFRGIRDVEIDQQELKDAIDSELIHLVEAIDPSESGLRREEEYLMLVKAKEGDEEQAKTLLARREEARKSRKMDLIDQMADVLMIENADDVPPSRKRTALTFLGDYVNKGFDSYLAEKKSDFPTQIKIRIDDWSGVLKQGTDQEEAKRSYMRHANEVYENEKIRLTDTSPKSKKTGGIVCLILAALCCGLFFVIGPAAFALAAILVFIAIGLFISRSRSIKDMNYRLEKLERATVEKNDRNLAKLNKAAGEWARAQNTVSEFETNGYEEIL